MRIALVVHSFPAISETFIVTKFASLLEAGWDVHLVCTEEIARNWGRYPSLNPARMRPRIHRTWPTQPKWWVTLLLPIVTFWCLLRNPVGAWRYLSVTGWAQIISGIGLLYSDARLICLKPEIVHYEFGPLARHCRALRHALGCKVLVSFRGYDINYSGLEESEYYSEVWEKADALHLLGEDLWRRALRRGCPATKPHRLIPPAIDLENFDPANRLHRDVVGATERPLRILSVGRLVWVKGYEYGMAAVAQLRQKGIACEYRIVGGGDSTEWLAFARHQLGLADCLEFVGPQSAAEIRRQMEWADVFLHSAVSEGFCNAVLEAQAMQLPVVCSDAGGLPENVKDGETGFIVPRRNSVALAEKLKLLALSPLLRTNMGRAGRERVARNFQIQDQIEKFETLYQQVMVGQIDETRMESTLPKDYALMDIPR